MKSWRSERVRQEEPCGQHRQRGDKWGGACWMPKWFPWHGVCQRSGGKCARNRCFLGTEKWNINESIGNTWIAGKKKKKKGCLGGGKLNKNCSCAEFPSAQTLTEAVIAAWLLCASRTQGQRARVCAQLNIGKTGSFFILIILLQYYY